MDRDLVKPLILIALSTLAYYFPGQIVDISSININDINKTFYKFYCIYTSSLFFLIAAYSVSLFIEIKIQNLKQKLLYLWLAVAETLTFVNHVLSKILGLDLYRSGFIVSVLIVFSCCCLFVIYRAKQKEQSDSFKPNHNYLIKQKPKNFIGLLNYLYNHSGHKSIYYAMKGKIYGFHRSTGVVEERPATNEFFQRKDIIIKKIGRIEDPEQFIGEQYHLLKFNCNDLIRHATGRKSA